MSEFLPVESLLDQIICGDALDVARLLPSGIANCIITSPPYYGLRDYGIEAQLGQEETPEAYVERLTDVFSELWRVLADDGTLWLNLGDSYWQRRPRNGVAGGQGREPLPSRHKATRAGGQGHPTLKPKDLVMIPARVAIALQGRGWYIRQDIIWTKSNPMPESVKDRFTRSHEYIFLLSKQERYYFDGSRVKEPLSPDSDVAYRQELRASKQYDAKAPYQKNFPKTFDMEKRNRRSVWTVNAQPRPDVKHIAPFPPALVEIMLMAGCPEGGIVLDPFIGSGTVAEVARAHRRHYIGIELHPDNVAMALNRLRQPFQTVKRRSEPPLTDLPLFSEES